MRQGPGIDDRVDEDPQRDDREDGEEGLLCGPRAGQQRGQAEGDGRPDPNRDGERQARDKQGDADQPGPYSEEGESPAERFHCFRFGSPRRSPIALLTSDLIADQSVECWSLANDSCQAPRSDAGIWPMRCASKSSASSPSLRSKKMLTTYSSDSPSSAGIAG